MVRDDDLLTDDLAEALGKAAEPLSGSARVQIRERVMHSVRADGRGGLFILASHRVAAAATALAMLGGGVAYATERSLPGDPLYGLKIAAENTAVAVIPSGKLENRLLVTIAARRARETADLARRGSEPGTVDDSLGTLREAVREATPAENRLGEEEAARIRERGSHAPTRTREAIDAAVAAPTEQVAPGGAAPTEQVAPGGADPKSGGQADRPDNGTSGSQPEDTKSGRTPGRDAEPNDNDSTGTRGGGSGKRR